LLAAANTAALLSAVGLGDATTKSALGSENTSWRTRIRPAGEKLTYRYTSEEDGKALRRY
jgi:hypothetical protein